jgi:putative DNA primase/helicase
VYDLKQYTFRSVQASDNFLNTSPVVFDENAKCPLWIKFLKRFQPDRDMRVYLQKLVGLTLVGNVTEEIMVFLHGPAATSKSTFTNVLMALFGDSLAVKISTKVLLSTARNNECEIARVRGARLVVASEVPEGKKFDDALLKDLASRDQLTGGYLYKDSFQFWPAHTLWLYGNHLGRLPSDDSGIWRRLKRFPCEQVIDRDERIEDLDQQLMSELPGILNWALEGCRNWQEDGALVPPKIVQSATDEYQADMDVLAPFLAECIVSKEGARVGATALYKAYKAHSGHDADHLNPTSFGLALKERGFRKGPRQSEGKYYKGVRLKKRWEVKV